MISNMMMFKNYPIKQLLLFIMLGCIAQIACAQDTVVNTSYRGPVDTLHSVILGQDRQVQVLLPAGYTPGSGKKYDVLYNLDGGNWNTGLIAQVQHFAEGNDFMPPTIIVSIIQPDRNADLGPTHLESWNHSGNAGNFLAFIKKELIPYINSHYPSNGDNTLWGHSLAGMFVFYALINEPGLFKSYIAMDPSVWWDDCYVLKMAAARLPAMVFDNTTFFAAGRDNDMHDMKIDSLETVLKTTAPASLKWKLNVYPKETHSSMRLKGTYDGLRFTYEGHIKNMYFSPQGGIVLKGKPFKLFYGDDTAHMHYTIDGTLPTLASPQVLPEITVDGPAKVTYKVFTNRSRYDKVVTGDFTDEPMPRPLPAPPKGWQSGGFNYAYYEGDWDSFPGFSHLKPIKTGYTDSNFRIEKLPYKAHHALVIDGLIEAKEEGYYIFGLGGSDKGTKMYIGGKLVVDFTSDREIGKDIIVPLSKGFYTFRIECVRKNGAWDALDWQQVLTPSLIESQNSILIPVAMQYGRR